MNYFSYKIEHDFGLAPNPFHGYCTLAVCKSSIRSNTNLEIGDWIIGTGSKSLGNHHELIFAMCIEEKLTFNEYWEDNRFEKKKPIVNGSLVQMYGDNFYHQDPNTEEWIQENSAHSLDDGSPNKDHLIRDTGGTYVLISKEFYYFGGNSPLIPDEYIEICSEGRDMKSVSIPKDVAEKFIYWIKKNYSIGIHGDPTSWQEHLK
jgi:hypothetical protein